MSNSKSSKRRASRLRLDTFFPTVKGIFRDVPLKLSYPFTFTPSSLPGIPQVLNIWYFPGFTRHCFQICRTSTVIRHTCKSTAVDASDLQAAKETIKACAKYLFPLHLKSMQRLDFKKDSPSLTPDNDKYVVLLKLICITWESYFPAPTLLEPRIYDNMDPRVSNLLRLTQTRPAASVTWSSPPNASRSALGFHLKTWQRLSIVFRGGILSLVHSSFPRANPISPTVNSTSSALISANFASLIKNIERLNDLCTIARNMLATNELAQDLAAMAKFEKQIMMLVDTCVRVTARGYDGPIDGGDRQSQERWQKVVATYKKLLITCLQFLHNFIMHNENRKLGLWMDLFTQPLHSDNCHAKAPVGDLGRCTFDSDGPPSCVSGEDKSNREVEAVANRVKSLEPPPGGVASPNDATGLDPMTESKASNSKQVPIDTDSMGQAQCASVADEVVDIEEGPETPPPVGDMEIRSASEATSNLENAKQRLLERIRDNSQMHFGGEHGCGNAYGSRDDARPDGTSEVGVDDVEDDEDEEDEEGDECYRGLGDQERGLLTDIPLVLAPTEIEALPMILQAGIVPQFGDKTLQNARCNILLAQDSGRNLLRELLIFIAAWDLPDEEIYFRLMQQIVQAILENGLMPLAYTVFTE
ncbi:hypothetical protein GP486_005415 [Trichoglossum hirsutum]|uniref:Uncharacterized protein n=1 Tax=Trichoglossum hirsutum TaxID=265104 RepID=A0A9P8RMP6_9PEZI|nr:hypothetical protein GP486_005415 [Trichoglossum hirsutum]